MSEQRTVLELCAGGGGQACGLERAGFHHQAAVDIESACTDTLRLNRPGWRVLTKDIREVDGTDYRGVDLIAGGVPCSPFSVAGKQHGVDDERDLFPEALRIVDRARPTAVMLENVAALASDRFTDYRVNLLVTLEHLGYLPVWKVLNASAFGVPQLRPRFVLVALQRARFKQWSWPTTSYRTPPTVGHTLEDLMQARGWQGAHQWAEKAGGVAPTIVGGSHKHGGPDLGPTRARRVWSELGVNGLSLADEAPGPDAPEGHCPKLTVRMVARVQGLPDEWELTGGKTARYRQVGNAFPPPVAAAVGESIHSALAAGRRPDPPCDRYGGSRRQPLRVDIGQDRLFLSTLMCPRLQQPADVCAVTTGAAGSAACGYGAELPPLCTRGCSYNSESRFGRFRMFAGQAGGSFAADGVGLRGTSLCTLAMRREQRCTVTSGLFDDASLTDAGLATEREGRSGRRLPGDGGPIRWRFVHSHRCSAPHCDPASPLGGDGGRVGHLVKVVSEGSELTGQFEVRQVVSAEPGRLVGLGAIGAGARAVFHAFVAVCSGVVQCAEQHFKLLASHPPSQFHEVGSVGVGGVKPPASRLPGGQRALDSSACGALSMPTSESFWLWGHDIGLGELA